MAFLDELKEYLRRVGYGVGVQDVASRVNMAAARQHFLAALDRAEALVGRGRPFGVKRSSLGAWHSDWIGQGWLPVFVERAEVELREGLGAGATVAEMQTLVHQVIECALGVPIEDISGAREFELSRVASASLPPGSVGLPKRDFPRYSFENRLVRGSGARLEISAIGRVLLDLPEAEAVRWLLSIETSQSLGEHDDMRMHVDTLSSLARELREPFWGNRIVGEGDDGEPVHAVEQWLFESMTFLRLRAMGVIKEWIDDEGGWGYSLVPAYRETLEDIVARKRTPLSMLAESLLADERNSVAGHAASFVPLESSAMLQQALHARMVTHEIRNTVVPMRMALSELYRTLATQVPDDAWRSPRERIDRGVERLFRFVSELEQVANLSTTPLAPFDLVAAIQDAIKNLNGGLGLTVHFEPPRDLPRLVGHRPRFTLVVVNLLRNSAQNNTRPGATTRVRAVLSDTRVIVTVDDDGPGVPEAHREEIFRVGVALRPGGSGLGLALVREVVQNEMRGAARCEQSDLGGARFVLEIPIETKENP